MFEDAFILAGEPGAAEATRAWRLFVGMSLLLLVFGLAMIALALLRRHRRRAADRPAPHPAGPTDPWSESARRVRVTAVTEDGREIDSDDIPPPDKNA